MKAVVGVTNGGLRLVSLDPPAIVAQCGPLTRQPSTVTFVVFDPSVSESIRYTTGSVIVALSHSPVLYRIRMDPYSLEKIELPSKYPIVMMKLAVDPTPLMHSSHIEIRYRPIGQRSIIVLQGDGVLSEIQDSKVVRSIKLKKWDITTVELEEPKLISEEEEEERLREEQDGEDVQTMSEEDGENSDEQAETANASEGEESMSEESGEEEAAEGSEEEQKEGGDAKKSYVLPKEIPGLTGVYDVGYDYVIASNQQPYPIRQYYFDGRRESTPVIALRHVSACVIEDEAFLGTSDGRIQRYSFSEKKRQMLSTFRKVYADDDLAHPKEREDVRELKHPIVVAEVSRFPIISICPTSDPRIIACGTSSGLVRLFDVQKNSVCFSMKGPQGSVRLSSSGRYLVAVSLDRWLYVWDTEARKAVSKIYLKYQASAVALSAASE